MDKSINMTRIVFLAIVAAIGGILFGYDTAVISGTTEIVKNQFRLTTIAEGWYVGCALIGSILGVMTAGMMSDHLGRKKTMLISALMFSVSAIGCAVCGDFNQLVVFRIIGGFGIGIVSIVSPIYISEIAPAQKRGSLVSLYQLAITIGFLMAYLVNYFVLKGADVTSTSTDLWTRIFNSEYWRGMLGYETVPDLLFLLVIFLIPESPRWLITKHKEDKAARILGGIFTSPEEVARQIEQTRASIAGETKSEWRTLLEPGIFKAVLIGCAIAILGQFMGVNAVLYYGPKIFSDAGLSGESSMFSTVLVGDREHAHDGHRPPGHRQGRPQAVGLVGCGRNDSLSADDRPVLLLPAKPSDLVPADVLPSVRFLHGDFHKRGCFCTFVRDVP